MARGKKVIPAHILKRKLTKKYGKASGGKILGSIVRRAMKGPGQSKFKPRTKAGKARYGKK